MKYRYLGSTGLSVSELCFGAMTFGEKGAFLGAPGRNWSEFGVVPEHTAYDLVYKALDAGINFFDTADCYKNGQGEELLGNALKGKRQQVIIGTKGRWQTDPNPNALGASRYHIINAVDASLQRLKISVTKYKMIAFVTSAVLAGAAGTLYGCGQVTFTATKFDFNTSILILVFVVLGGLGNMWGSVIAAAALTILPEALRQFADYRMLVYAIVLILVMLATNNPTLWNFIARVREERQEKKEGAKQ